MIHNEDCLDTMRRMDAGSVDLIMTSPPYAGKRTDQYPAPDPGKYVDWFMRRAFAMADVLKPSGSLIVNIKEGTTDGARQTYVMELVQAMIRAGWTWVDEYAWIKSNPLPGKWPNRLKDGFERCHHFALTTRPKFNPDAVARPLGKAAQYHHDNPPPCKRVDRNMTSKTGSGRTVNPARKSRNNYALPSNVININIGKRDQRHPAIFPAALPEFFIKLLSDPGDLVYDPFMGSGTTLLAAKLLGRQYSGSETSAEYCDMAKGRIGQGVLG